MKKIILGSIAILAIVTLAVINLNVSSNSQNDNMLSNFSLSNTEALAGEWGGWDNFWQGQGFYMDEREESQPCPSEESSSGSGSVSYGGGSVSGGGSSSTTNPSGRKEYFCLVGNSNCTSHSC